VEAPSPAPDPPTPAHVTPKTALTGPAARAKKPRSPGFLTVEAKPEWATISVNGKALGPSPIYRHQMEPGRWTIEGVRTDGSRRKRVAEISSEKETIVILQW
jgi:hypothetical protein